MQESRNCELVGHVEGLLEAWCDYGLSMNWKRDLGKLPDEKKARIRQFRNLLDSDWLIVEMDKKYSLYRDVLVEIAKL